MISLKLTNSYDLNSINQYVKNKLEKKDITWLPTYKDKINNKENINDFNENNLIVYKENISNYKIRNNN